MKRIVLLALAGLAAAVTVSAAQVARVAVFTGTIVNLAGAEGAGFSVDLLRWSTDAEREAVTTAYGSKGDMALADALKTQPTVGYIWTGEAIGYPVRFAFTQPLPDGGARIVLATDRQLGSYSGRPWRAATPAQTQSYPYTVIELHMPRTGTGEGKLSVNAKVTSETAAKTLALENYAFAPVTLRNVRR